MLRHHDPHLRAREHQEVRRGLPLRRAPDGHAARDGRRALDLLSGREAHQGPGASATWRRSGMIAKMPTLAAFAYRHNLGLPYVYPDNDLDYPGNFLSMMFKMTELKYEPDPRLARALDVLWILHADHEQNCSTSAVRGVGLLAGRSVLGGRGRRRGALRAAARRRQRGRAEDARPDRHDGQHPGLPRGREAGQGAPDGLRPPRLQELRPARADHQEARRRGVRGDRAATRSSTSPSSSRSARSTTSTSRAASSTRTSTSTRA